MQAEQPTNLCKPQRKMNMNVWARKTGLNPPVIVTGCPKAILSLGFHLFYVWCCSIFKCFNFNTSVCPIYLVQ